MVNGQIVEVAIPIFKDVWSAMMPTIHGINTPPKLPDAPSNPNIDAPPCGKISAVVPNNVGHKQLPANPTIMQENKAKYGEDEKHANRKNITDDQQQNNSSVIGFTLFPNMPAIIRPNAIESENASNAMPPIHLVNPRLFSA